MAVADYQIIMVLTLARKTAYWHPNSSSFNTVTGAGGDGIKIHSVHVPMCITVPSPVLALFYCISTGVSCKLCFLSVLLKYFSIYMGHWAFHSDPKSPLRFSSKCEPSSAGILEIKTSLFIVYSHHGNLCSHLIIDIPTAASGWLYVKPHTLHLSPNGLR